VVPGTEHTRALAPGIEIPVLGFGTWQIPDGDEAYRAVAAALGAGYRHIDTAQAYGNEASVGRAMRDSGLPREDIFLTTKFNPGNRNPVVALERSVERLGVEHVDLYLVHDPRRGPAWAWPGMEAALERGLTRAIGISNFDAGEVDAVCRAANTQPTVNQLEINPFSYRRALLAACERHGIAVQAWSPLTHGRDLEDPTLAAVAAACERTPAQVLLRWGLQRDLIVLPKSVRPQRIDENARIFDFELSDEQVAQLDGLDRTGGTEVAVEDKWWTFGPRARGFARRLAERVRR
jgi:diketogulonate reductase-like aldo/keto reductase